MFDSQMYYRSSVKKRTDKEGKIWYQALAHYKEPTGELSLQGKPKFKYDAKTRKIPDEISKRGQKARKAFAEDFREYLNAQMYESPVESLDYEDTKTVDEVVKGFLAYQLSTGELEQSTYDVQLRHWESHGTQFLGDYGFKSLNKNIVMDWLTYLHSLGLKESTIYHYYKIPRKTYSYYVEEGEIGSNPFNFRGRPTKPTAAKTTHLTQDQNDHLLECLDKECMNPETGEVDITHLLYRMITILCNSGLRRGELCGLRWSSIDFETNYLSVNTSIGIANGRTYTKLPKNQTSAREFKMIASLADYLKALYDLVKPQSNWFVLTDSKNYLSPHMFTLHFNNFRDKYKLVDAYGKKLTPHGIRHNFGYAGIQSGADIDSLQKMFGHSRRSMTLDTYGDGSPEAMNLAAERINAFFQRQAKRKEEDQ